MEFPEQEKACGNSSGQVKKEVEFPRSDQEKVTWNSDYGSCWFLLCSLALKFPRGVVEFPG